MRSSRRGAVDPFIVMDVMEAARKAEEAGRHIIHMEVGQPGTPAPRLAREAVALDERLNYDEPWGWMMPVRHSLGAVLLEQP